jgi:SAM-dependent methyltransferase
MKRHLLRWLICPACEDGTFELDVQETESAPLHSVHRDLHVHRGEAEEALPAPAEEILEGHLTCAKCGRVYAIRGGIPRLLVEGTDRRPDPAYAWTTFSETQPAWEAHFRDIIQPLGPDDFLGRLTLDAGCGFGRNAFFAARYGAEVVAVDVLDDAVDAARRNTAHLVGVHVVQADIYHLPFRRGLFDMILALGVLHHLPRPREAFQALSRGLVSGGRLCTWTYGPRQGLNGWVTRGLRATTTRLEPTALHNLSRGIAGGLRVFSHLPYQIFQNMPVGKDIVTHLPIHEHARWPFDVVVADVYDRLRVPVTATPPGEVIERWYEEEGFVDISVTRRVGNNESFRGTGVRR